MAAPPSSRLQNMLQAAVQSVQWTYSLFWQICPQQGILVWGGDGYYNGAIKTRKTVQRMEVSPEETSLQRSQQLRELYESLSAGETNQPTRRPCAALSPEDLTESEWFYLMCVSFSFPPGVGLPGKAYARRQHVWLAGANEVDRKTFSRAFLAKSARIQTVVCIPLLDGVVEFGNTDKVQEDLGFIQHVKGFFSDHCHTHPLPLKPALSEHSTSNPATSADHFHFQSASAPALYGGAAASGTPINTNQEDEEEDNGGDEEEEEAESDDSEAETGGRDQNPSQAQISQGVAAAAAEPSELMQVEMFEDMRLGSPDDGSNNMDPDNFPLIGTENADEDPHQRRVVDSFRAESSPRWTVTHDPLTGSLELPPSVPSPLEDLIQDDIHYSQTVSTILQTQSTRWVESTISYMPYSNQSAFAKWTARSDQHLHVPVEGTSQWLLKYILFSVPYLHSKYREENSPKLRENDAASNRFRKGTQQEEPSANHVLAERRRREKLNEKFVILRSLVPFVTKMDKASILGDTIEYVKQLRKKNQDLEASNRQMELEKQSRLVDPSQRTSSKELRSGVKVVDRARVGPRPDKRKLRIVEGSGDGTKPKVAESPPPETSVEVSIIETDALLELQCRHREGLLLDIMQMLSSLRIETTVVQSSLNNGVFVGELRAKVKDNVYGKKVSITEVKRAVHQVIPHD